MITITKSATDPEMVEITTKNHLGNISLWGVVHEDFMYETNLASVWQELKETGASDITLDARLTQEK